MILGEKELGIENAQSIIRLISAGRGLEVVETIKTFSIEGRTAKQNPIMFALALCAKSDHLPTKQAAYASLLEICRIPTHLFMYVNRKGDSSSEMFIRLFFFQVHQIRSCIRTKLGSSTTSCCS